MLNKTSQYIDINQVADFILSFAREHGDNLTNLKVQKLAYYAQAWYLALYDIPLCDEQFEAWVHGPVNVKLYNRFKEYDWKPIEAQITQPQLGEPESNHLKEVMDVFGGFTAYELERMTHEELPWKNARGNLAPDMPSSNVISNEDMRTFYKSME